MLKLQSNITIIKYKDKTKNVLNYPLKQSFRLGSSSTADTLVEADETTINKETYRSYFENGEEVYIEFKFVTDIEITSSFNNLTKTAIVTLPRNLDFNGIDVVGGNYGYSDSKLNEYPIFSIGDRIIIELGYEDPDLLSEGTTTLQEFFRGYITKIDNNTPLVLHCEDMMYYLKRNKVKYPDDVTYKGESLKPITFRKLIERTLISKKPNNLYLPVDNNFDFDLSFGYNEQYNVSPFRTPVYINNIDTLSFHYSTQRIMNISEMFNELKKKTGIVCYFDEFNNLHFELPFQNTLSKSSSANPKYTFLWESQVIDHNLDYQDGEDVYVRLELSSECVDKKGVKLYAYQTKGNNFYGDADGNIITVNYPPYKPAEKDATQAQLNKLAETLYASQKYTGYAKGSTFTTFGEPAVFMGDHIRMVSTKYPERNGTFQVVGVKRTFGIDGYRQEIELGVGIFDNDIKKT